MLSDEDFDDDGHSGDGLDPHAMGEDEDVVNALAGWWGLDLELPGAQQPQRLSKKSDATTTAYFTQSQPPPRTTKESVCTRFQRFERARLGMAYKKEAC